MITTMWIDIIKTYPLVLMASFILDAIIGDPSWMPHPVRLMGRIISQCDQKFNNGSHNNAVQILKGSVFAGLLTFVTAIISMTLLLISFKISYIFGIFIEIIMSTYCLAGHDLIKHAMNVYNNRYDIAKARASVGMIVGRDTENLSEQGVIKATIESISESLCDGVSAPAFYTVIFGPAGGMTYKAINTMDSMIGYHNEKYEYYGKPAAIADDIVNFIPSRLSALFIIAASFLLDRIYRCYYFIRRESCGKVYYNYRNAWRIWRRDGRKHLSPNSAQTESAMAGALDIRLGGPAVYFGKIVDKPYIGDDDCNKELSWEEIRRACIVMYTAALLMISSVCVFAAVITYLIWH